MNHLAMKCTIDVPPVNLIKKQMETFGGKMTVKAIVSNNKLLFAEVDDDFVDFLFSLLALPLGGAEWLLGCDTCLTNIDNLYKSLSNMGMNKYLKSIDKTKAQLLHPMLPLCYYSRTRFLSPTFHCLYFSQDSMHSVNPSGCGSQVKCYKFPEGEVEYSRLTCLWVLKYWQAKYVKGQTIYMVTDDLTVTPLSSATGLSVLNNLKIPLSNVEELELVVGLEEALSILKASLTSSCALTDGLITPFLMKQPKQEG
ncbi:hypothetical protein STAS_19945 [Striga asiatica]|uniref:Uncharacterized protein n=1 Tax=Striga asiatica TaxID=4170 RepID=A0A5A7QD44_STRAF|nr:hypothetical protein STAS_19945 [Striga asiatica]